MLYFIQSHSSTNAALSAKKHLPNWQAFLDDYRQHWVTWVYSGIPSSMINFDKKTELRVFLKPSKS